MTKNKTTDNSFFPPTKKAPIHKFSCFTQTMKKRMVSFENFWPEDDVSFVQKKRACLIVVRRTMWKFLPNNSHAICPPNFDTKIDPD